MVDQAGILCRAVVVFTIVAVLVEALLRWLDFRACARGIPSAAHGGGNRRAGNLRYFRRKGFARWADSSAVLLLVLLLFTSGSLSSLEGFVGRTGLGPVPGTLLFFGILFVPCSVLSVAVSAYDTLVVEGRRTTGNASWRTFLSDTLKTLPLFVRMWSLPEGELRTAIGKFTSEVGFDVEDICLVDASRHSTSPNAFLTGLGKRKKIVLFDSLVNVLTVDQVVGVLAHEVGHLRNRHPVCRLCMTLCGALLLLYSFSLVVDSGTFSLSAGCPEPSLRVNLVVYSLLVNPVVSVMSVLSNILSRRMEREADAFALASGQGWAEAQALRRLSPSSSDQDPLVVFLEYSHPPLGERLSVLESGGGPPIRGESGSPSGDDLPWEESPRLGLERIPSQPGEDILEEEIQQQRTDTYEISGTESQ